MKKSKFSNSQMIGALKRVEGGSPSDDEALHGRVVDWRGSSLVRTDFMLAAPSQALYARRPEREDDPIHRIDSGSQSVFPFRHYQAVITRFALRRQCVNEEWRFLIAGIPQSLRRAF